MNTKQYVEEFANIIQAYNVDSQLAPNPTGGLWGKEIEFIVPFGRATSSRLRKFLQGDYKQIRLIAFTLDYHTDYSTAHEITLPPVSLPIKDEHAVLYNMGETLTILSGIRVRMDGYNSQSCGSHLHFSFTDRSLMARVANWLMVLSPLSVYLRSNPWEITASEIIYSEWAWRPRIEHFARPPRFVDRMLVQNAPRQWRGLRPDNNPNSFYAIEINRYRKDAITIEDRIPESHWLGDYALLALAYSLGTILPPPILDLTRFYRMIYSAKNSDFLDANPELITNTIIYSPRKEWFKMETKEFLEDVINIAIKQVEKLDPRLPPVVEGLLKPRDYYVWLYRKSMEWVPEKYSWLEETADLFPSANLQKLLDSN